MNESLFSDTTSVSIIQPAAVASITERLQDQTLEERNIQCLSVTPRKPMSPSCIDIISHKKPAETFVTGTSPPAPPCKRHCRSLSVPVDVSAEKPLYSYHPNELNYHVNLQHKSSVWHVPKSRRRRRSSGYFCSPSRIHLLPRPASVSSYSDFKLTNENCATVFNFNSNSLPTLLVARKKVKNKKHRSRPSLDFTKVSESAYIKCAIPPNLEQIAASPLENQSSQTLADSAYSLFSLASLNDLEEESSSKRSEDDLAIFDTDLVSDLDIEQIEND